MCTLNRDSSNPSPRERSFRYQFVGRDYSSVSSPGTETPRVETPEIDAREGKPLSFHSRTEISSAGNSWRASTVAASRSARINSHRRRFDRPCTRLTLYTRVCVRAHAHGGRRRVRLRVTHTFDAVWST